MLALPGNENVQSINPPGWRNQRWLSQWHSLAADHWQRCICCYTGRKGRARGGRLGGAGM